MKDPETKEELCKRCKIGYVGITVLNNDGLCFPCETELRKIKFDSAPPETSSWEEEFRKLPHYKIFLEDQIAFIRNLASSEYKRGRQSMFDEMNHEQKKLLDGFNHPKGCEMCNK